MTGDDGGSPGQGALGSWAGDHVPWVGSAGPHDDSSAGAQVSSEGSAGAQVEGSVGAHVSSGDSPSGAHVCPPDPSLGSPPVSYTHLTLPTKRIV